MSGRLTSNFWWLIGIVAVLVCAGIPLILKVLPSVCSSHAAASLVAWQSGPTLYVYVVKITTWIGVILLGAPPFYGMTLRVLLSRKENVDELLRTHNRRVLDDLQLPSKPGQPVPATGNPWRAVIDSMENWQWQLMLAGFYLVALTGAVETAVSGYLLTCA